MANEAVGLTIDVGGDTDQGQAALNAVGTTLEDLDTKLDSVISNLDNLDQAFEKLGGTNIGGADQIDQLSSSLNDVADANASLADSSGQSSEEMNTAEESAGSLGDTAANVAQILGTFTGEMDKVVEGITKTGEAAAKAEGGLGGILTVGTAAVSLFAVLGEAGGQYATQLSRLSDVTGLSIENTEKLSIAMADVGGNSQALMRGSSMISSAMTQANAAIEKGGELSGKAAILINTLGISIKESSGEMRTGGAVFEDTLQKLGTMSNKTEAVGLAIQLFGSRMGGQMIPLIRNYTEVMDSAEQQSQIMGDTTEDLGRKAIEFNTAQESLALQFHKLALEVLPAFTGALKAANATIEIVEKALGSLSGVVEFFTESSTNASAGGFALAAGLIAFGGPLGAIAGTALAAYTGIKELDKGFNDTEHSAKNAGDALETYVGREKAIAEAYRNADHATGPLSGLQSELSIKVAQKLDFANLKVREGLEKTKTAADPTPINTWAKAIEDAGKAADGFNSKTKDILGVFDKFRSAPTAETIAWDMAIDKTKADIAAYAIVLNSLGKTEDEHSKQLAANLAAQERKQTALKADRQVSLDAQAAEIVLQQYATGTLKTEKQLLEASEKTTQASEEKTMKALAEAKAQVILNSELIRTQGLIDGLSNAEVDIVVKLFLDKNDIQGNFNLMKSTFSDFANTTGNVVDKAKDLTSEIDSLSKAMTDAAKDGVATLNEQIEIQESIIKGKLTPAAVAAAEKQALYAVSLERTNQQIAAAMASTNIQLNARLLVDSALRDSILKVADAEYQAKVNAAALTIALQEGGGAFEAFTSKLAENSVEASTKAFNDLMSGPSREEATLGLRSDKLQLAIDRMADAFAPAIDRLNDFKDGLSDVRQALSDQKDAISSSIEAIDGQISAAEKSYSDAKSAYDKSNSSMDPSKRAPGVSIQSTAPMDYSAPLKAQKAQAEAALKGIERQEKMLDKQEKEADRQIKNYERQENLLGRQKAAVDRQLAIENDVDKILKDDFALANHLMKTDKERQGIAETLTNNLDNATTYLGSLNKQVPTATANLLDAGLKAKALADALDLIRRNLPNQTDKGGGGTSAAYSTSSGNEFLGEAT